MSEETEYKGYTIKIEQDDDPPNPREWDNIGKMACFHGRYSLGDKHDHTFEMFDGWDEFETHLIKEHDAVIILPLYLYDHSGIRIKVGSFNGLLPQGHAEFDSGMVGFIYADKETIKKEYGKLTKANKAKAEKYIRCEVETYDKYIRGDFVGFIVEKDGEQIDSCWGFDDEAYAMSEAKGIVDWHVKEARKKKQAKTRAFVINHVPLYNRIAVTA